MLLKEAVHTVVKVVWGKPFEHVKDVLTHHADGSWSSEDGRVTSTMLDYIRSYEIISSPV